MSTPLFRSGWWRVSRRPVLVSCFAVCVAFLSGCGAVGPSWETGVSSMRSTMKDTKEFINPAPAIDVNRYKWENPNQEKLALLFSPVDARIMALTRYVTSIDYRPDEAWINALLTRFPWVDGVIVADENGEILMRRPPVPLKRFSEPLVFESIWRETLVKTVVDYTALGPELYFGMPNFDGADFKGLHVISFDPRVLFSFCPEPEQLVIVDPRAQKLWTSTETPPAGAVELTNIPWLEIMKEKIHGTVMAGEKQYTWLARFIGRDLFVFATESANASIEDKGFSIPFFGGNS
ncbi:hypothetical protein SAMN04488503_0326 [Humidesulfovibrio mexicanus]|uniref:Uncharacterized protein n=2 Tax=Humidesulfovibrio mexicanus TaxID=147047 RepID=A0A238XQT4_9BACT|nr:hypothetical protein SAMN04488503_0326 [Humidesulfovibrio mexicanus]